MQQARTGFSNVTTQGNTFNGNSQLVQLTAAGKYPALDGSLITGVSAGVGSTESKTASWTIADDDTVDLYSIEFSATTKMIVATLPTLADNLNKIKTFKISGYGIFKTIGEGAETIDGKSAQYCFSDGDIISIRAMSTEWKILKHTLTYSTGGANTTDWTARQLGNVVVTMDNVTGAYEVGEIVKEYSLATRLPASETGRYGIIIAITATTLTLIFADGVATFTNNYYLKGQNSSATSDVNGASKNVGSNIIHLTGYLAKDFDVQTWVCTSTTFNQTSAYLLSNGCSVWRGNGEGITLAEVDTTQFGNYTSSSGVTLQPGLSAQIALDVDDYSYCVYIRRRI